MKMYWVWHVVSLSDYMSTFGMIVEKVVRAPMKRF